jgi:hypothetical protein
MSGLLDAALSYAARGIPVYPIHWPRPSVGGTSLSCSCRRGVACDRPAKHPLTRHGVHDATTAAAQLERWWHQWPAANIGLATGIRFDVLDIDGADGLAALRQLAGTREPWLPGPLVRTGGGGWHYWFAPTGLGNRPPRGLAHVDWRGVGGAVLAPPSRHATGKHYRWVRGLDQGPLPEVPAALRALLYLQLAPASPVIPPRPAATGHAYGRRVLAAELATLRQAPVHTRNRTLNTCAFKVYRYVAGGLLDDQEVTAALTTAALSIGLDPTEIGRTLASARTAGLANPRGLPPVGPQAVAR